MDETSGVSPDDLRIRTTHHIDSDEPNADGKVDWYYEYDIHTFTLGAITLVARSYTDDPTDAHFLRIEESGMKRGLQAVDLDRPIFQMAVAHLRQLGKTKLTWLSPMDPAYQPLDQG